MEAEAKAQNFELKEEKGLISYMGNWKLAFGYIN